MAALLDTSSLNFIPHAGPKSPILPAVVDPTHLPLFEALGLPGDDEFLAQGMPPKQPLDIPLSMPSRDNNRSRRPSKADSQHNDITPQRARHLERNRVAANKCRLKKKKEQEHIQSTLNEASVRRDSLLAEVGGLKEELWHLKNQVLAHAKCGDHQINTQLARMTQNVLQRSPEEPPCPSPTFSLSTRSDGSSGIEFKPEEVPAQNYAEDKVYDDDFEPLFDKFIEAGNI